MAEPVSHEELMEIAAFRAHLRAFLRHNERTCRAHGLTPQRYLLLLAIKGAPDGSERLSLTEAAERLQLSRNTVTELCTRAEAAGLVRREPSETDQRVVYLRVTPEGERRLVGVVQASDRGRAELLRSFEDLARAVRAG
jgi:DNA-binding MarR family transcriptional regulator